jgi:hypothetical protein
VKSARHGSRAGRWGWLLGVLAMPAAGCEIIAGIPNVVDGRPGAACPEPGGKTGDPALFSAATRPVGIALHAGVVYWAESGMVRGVFAGSGEVAEEWDDGGDPEEVVADASGVYWSHTGFGCITRADPSGDSSNFGACLGARGGQLALDDTHVYWVVGAGSSGNCTAWPACCTDAGNGCVVRATKDGENIDVYLADESAPTALAIDDTHVYWSRVTASGGVIMRCLKESKQDCSASAEAFLEDAGVLQQPTRMVIDGDHLYWLDKGKGEVHRVRTTEPALGSERIAESGAYGTSLVVDDTHVYWRGDVDVWRRDKLLAALPQQLGGKGAHSVAVDCTHVYFTEQPEEGMEGVFRAAR